jgi:hypothetical protein
MATEQGEDSCGRDGGGPHVGALQNHRKPSIPPASPSVGRRVRFTLFSSRDLDDLTWYMHIQDHHLVRRTKPMQEGEVTIPDIVYGIAGILHVHDSLSITSIPFPAPTLSSVWNRLNWCRVERCPNMECVFIAPQLQGSTTMHHFGSLKTFWASRLLKAY